MLTLRSGLITCAVVGGLALTGQAASIGNILGWLRNDTRIPTLSANYMAARQDVLEWSQEKFAQRFELYDAFAQPAPRVVLKALTIRRDSPEVAATFDDSLEQFQSRVLVADMLEKARDIEQPHLEALPADVIQAVASLRTRSDDADDQLKSFVIEPAFAESFEVLAFEAILTSWGRPETRVHLVRAVAVQPKYQPQRLKYLWAVAHSGQPEVVRDAAATALWQGIKAMQAESLTDETLDELFWIYKADRTRECRPTEPVLQILGALSRSDSKCALEHVEEIVRLEREVYMPKCELAPWNKPIDVLRFELSSVSGDMGSVIARANKAGENPLGSKEIVMLQTRQKELNSQLLPTVLWESANELLGQLRRRNEIADMSGKIHEPAPGPNE